MHGLTQGQKTIPNQGSRVLIIQQFVGARSRLSNKIKQIFILQHFSKSLRFAHFCTAPKSKCVGERIWNLKQFDAISVFQIVAQCCEDMLFFAAMLI